MTAGPVVAALSAEAPPADQRGRYMASMQLAWSISSAVAPQLYSALRAVTNVAEPVQPGVRPAVPVDPAAEAPTIL